MQTIPVDLPDTDDNCRVNTQRLEEIQSLKAEKDGLQAIILEERAEKAALAAELKKTRDELARVRNDVRRSESEYK